MGNFTVKFEFIIMLTVAKLEQLKIFAIRHIMSLIWLGSGNVIDDNLGQLDIIGV